MFCKNCGSQIDDKAVPVKNNYSSQPKGKNALAIAGFILSIFIFFVGMACSVLAYKKCKNEGAPYKGLAIAGIVISSLATGLALAIILSQIIVACV